jgi:hypothetical protein
MIKAALRLSSLRKVLAAVLRWLGMRVPQVLQVDRDNDVAMDV